MRVVARRYDPKRRKFPLTTDSSGTSRYSAPPCEDGLHFARSRVRRQVAAEGGLIVTKTNLASVRRVAFFPLRSYLLIQTAQTR